MHKNSAVKLLVWSPEGSRLISGDQVRGSPSCGCSESCIDMRCIRVQSGVLGVWQCDSRARLLPLCQFAKKGAITHCTFQCPTAGSAAYGCVCGCVALVFSRLIDSCAHCFVHPLPVFRKCH